MAEPIYMAENRYSYVGRWRPSLSSEYEADSPETQFEFRVQSLFGQGQAYLQKEEYNLALDKFRDLMGLILRTAHPKMPVDPNSLPIFTFPKQATLIDTFASKAADILKKNPIVNYQFPSALFSSTAILPADTAGQLKPVLDMGLQVKSFQSGFKDNVDAAAALAEDQDWKGAIVQYNKALEQVPATEVIARASIMHDLAILNEKAGNKPQALELSQQSAKLFTDAKTVPEATVQALDTANGIFARAGNQAKADEFAKSAAAIRSTTNLGGILGSRLRSAVAIDSIREVIRPVGPVGPIRPALPVGPVGAAPAIVSTPAAPTLMMATFLPAAAEQRAYKVQGATEAATIVLDNNGPASVKNFLTTLSATQDLQIVQGYFASTVQWVAYLPHMYFFVIPMAMGDCYLGMGNLKQAEQEYTDTIAYPFINKQYELPKLWTRLAQVYLDLGDTAYRAAKDNVAAFAAAKANYERIVRLNKTLDANSPVYKDAKFAAIKTRVTNFLASANPATFNDNPAILTLVLEALTKLQQINANLNFFGFGLDYAPPFSFEYLQNTARYFAQQASQIEQRYIQFKSQAENEEFRREQLDQQAEVARQTVVLEQRGVAEAQSGINVAQAGLNYAETQRQNAVAAQNDFNNVRWELLELSEAEAWANGAAVDQDDEVLLTWHGNYYNSRDKRRSQVLQDLAYKRTRISHDLEANKLQREINSANAYKAVAQAQVAQAQARKAIAEQRVQIAQLQQRFAEENRDFLDMREFSAHLWYELAQQARRIKTRYLDMATEAAFLMERAYNAETERGLGVVRYDYSRTSSGNLLGADMLLADIDYFTLDHITTTKTKKIPVKRTISLADSYAMAFQSLKTKGVCSFITEFADFDREHPGYYLAKIRNIELIFIGITGTTSIAGTLRNIGASKFRRENGAIVSRLYPSDVMALSQYDMRQDALAFRFNPNDLRLFENNGIETMWRIDLPPGANDFDYNEILDVQLVLYYDGFFSPALEQVVKAALPASGSASRAFSMRLSSPDELFYLKNKGEAILSFDASMFPRNQTNLKRTTITMKASGAPGTANGLTLRLKSANHGAAEIVGKTDANGLIVDTAGQPLNPLRGEALFDTWTLRVQSGDNAGLVRNGALDLSGLSDILIFVEYTFDYR